MHLATVVVRHCFDRHVLAAVLDQLVMVTENTVAFVDYLVRPQLFLYI